MAFSKFVQFTARNLETGQMLQERDYTTNEIKDMVLSNKTGRLRFDNLAHIFEPQTLKAGDKLWFATRDELTRICKEVPLEVVEVLNIKTMKF